MRDVIIIGGGAAGLLAAIAAAREGAKVCLLERLNRVGKKILVTGNGRCNLTNTQIDRSCYHSESAEEILRPIRLFDEKETINFFESLGIMPLIEGRKVYPSSEQASSILDVLRMEVDRLNVEVLTDQLVIKLALKKNGWHIETKEGESFIARKVLVATGGLVNTALGCDGTGYKLLKSCGHQVSAIFPALVHVICESPYPKMMKGTKVKADTTIWIQGKPIRKEYGEVLFTEDGLSGPAIFQVSRWAAKAHLEKKEAEITLDLLRNYKDDEVVSLIYKRIALMPERMLEQLFTGMLNKRVALALFKAAKVNGITTRRTQDLEYDEIERLAQNIKAFRFHVNGTRGYKFAQVTAGGVPLDEVDLNRMASKKAKGLFLAGEVLDVDGDCGGFNLQWAWSTGYVAGREMARQLKEEVKK